MQRLAPSGGNEIPSASLLVCAVPAQPSARGAAAQLLPWRGDSNCGRSQAGRAAQAAAKEGGPVRSAQQQEDAGQPSAAAPSALAEPEPEPEPEPGSSSNFPLEQKVAWKTTALKYLRMCKDFRYYFQHPWSRLIVAYLVIFFNFLIFAEDPVSHSQTEANVIVVGNCFSFVTNKYPGEGSWRFLKVLLWLLAILTGLIAGKFLFHQRLFGQLLRLKMFREDHGSWMTMFFSTILFLFIFSHIYNLCLLMAEDMRNQPEIQPSAGMFEVSFRLGRSACIEDSFPILLNRTIP